MRTLTTATSDFSQCTCTHCGPATAARDGNRRCTVQVHFVRTLMFGHLLCGECTDHNARQHIEYDDAADDADDDADDAGQPWKKRKTKDDGADSEGKGADVAASRAAPSTARRLK